MFELNYLAVVVVTIVAFVVSSGWYMIFGSEWAKQLDLDEKAAADMQKPEPSKDWLVKLLLMAVILGVWR